MGYFNVVDREKRKICVKIPKLEIKEEKLNINQANIDFYVNALSELGKNETTFLQNDIYKNAERHFLHALCTFPLSLSM